MTMFTQEEPSGRPGKKSGMMESGGAANLPNVQTPPESGQIDSWSRLNHLYRISKQIAGFEVLENPLEAILGTIASTLPLRSAILIEGGGNMRSWISKDIRAEDFTAAIAHAEEMNEYFLKNRPDRPPTHTRVSDRNFVVIPLVVHHHPAFGVLQLECTARVNEADVTFINAVANQLAIALDRHNTRQREAMVLRTLGEFASIAAHDLKSPLSAIINFSEIIREGGSPERHPDFLDRIIRAAERMNRLISDLLDQSRLESEKIKLSTIDVGQMVNETWRDLGNIIEKKTATIELEPIPSVQAGRFQIRQLLQNLVGNALKYSRPDVAPVIHVSGRTITKERQRFVEVSIADNGIGFDPVFTGKIFEPFGRLHAARDYEGTGLGLAICKQIVERHGGAITAKSAVGEGSTFIFTLPADASG